MAQKQKHKKDFTIIRQLPHAVAVFDTKMHYIEASDFWMSKFKLKRSHIIGKCHYDIFPEISDEWKSAHKDALNGHIRKKEEDKFVRQDGTVHWVKWEVKPWLDHNNKIGGVIIFSEDITKQIKQKIQLQENRDLLEEAIKVSKVGWWERLLPDNTLHWSDITYQIHDAPKSFVPTMENIFNFFVHESDKLRIIKQAQELPKVGGKLTDIIKIKTFKNRIKWIRLIGETEFENGVCTRIHGIFQDITNEKLLEEKVTKSEEKFRIAFKSSAIGMALVSPDGTWKDVNDRLCEIVGYTRKELKKLTFQDITHPEDLSVDLELLNELIKGKRKSYNMEKRYIHKNGNIVWILLAVAMVADEFGQPIHFISQVKDITHEKKLNEKLYQERELLKSIIDNIPVNVSVKNLKSEKILINNTEDLYTKINKGNYSLKTIKEYLSLSNKEDEKVISSGKRIVDKELKFMDINGQENVYLFSKIPLRDSQNDIIGIIDLNYNITKIKKHEKDLKKLVNVTSSQNKRLLNFAHIVSHNLRSHSTNISSLLKLYHDETDIQTKNEMFSLIQQASDNLNKTILNLNEIVVINSATNEDKIPINLLNETNETLLSVKALIEEKDAIIKVNIPETIYLNTIPAYIESILLNLVTNSLKYSSKERKPVIIISAKKQKKHTKMTIKDNGLGIDLEKYGHKVFGMYKTFHGNDDARGIGLFITKNQIEALGGKITVSSKPNIGTTFKIYFYES